MTGLTNWITQMIILVIIMMIVTMILPDRKMKKYAQFSLSLIFILFFIQPISNLFNVNFETESLKIIDTIFGDLSTQTIENQFDLKKNEIQATSDAYVIEELSHQLKTEMEEEFAQTFDYQLKNIEIIQKDSETVDVESMIYHFQLTNNNAQISEVTPVIINTKNHSAQEEVKRDTADQEMIHWLSETLKIDQNQIQLSWEGG